MKKTARINEDKVKEVLGAAMREVRCEVAEDMINAIREGGSRKPTISLVAGGVVEHALDCVDFKLWDSLTEAEQDEVEKRLAKTTKSEVSYWMA